MELIRGQHYELTDTLTMYTVIKHYVLKPLLNTQHKDVQFKNMGV
jgi:hypothetical protein